MIQRRRKPIFTRLTRGYSRYCFNILWYYTVVLSRYFYWIRSMQNRSVIPAKVPALTATQGLHPRGIDPLFSHSNSVTTYVHILAIFQPRAQADNYNNAQITLTCCNCVVKYRHIRGFQCDESTWEYKSVCSLQDNWFLFPRLFPLSQKRGTDI